MTSLQIQSEKKGPGSSARPSTLGNDRATDARLGHLRVDAMDKPLGTTPREVRGDVPRTGRGQERTYSRGENGRSSLRFGHRTLPRLTTQIVTEAIKERVAQIAAKEIQNATHTSIRAAENVKAGLNAMSLTNFLNACRAIPELRALALEMMGCEAETDPVFVKGLSMLIDAHTRRFYDPSSEEGSAE